MNDKAKKSRLGFVVIKLLIDGDSYLLMRKNLTWKDVSFVGGHEESRDAGSLIRAARRELLEEIPALRSFKSLELVPLVENVTRGPVYSESAACTVEYTMSFFLLRLRSDPNSILQSLGGRSLNILVREKDLFTQEKYKVSALFQQLDQLLPEGIKAVPYSWEDDLGASVRNGGGFVLDQRELVLR